MMKDNGKGLGIDRTQPFRNKNVPSHNKLKGQATPVENKRNKTKRRLDRDMLPNPREYYAGVLQKFHPQGEQATALCPFHPDKKPSLSVNLKRGMFFCFSCETSGGDIIAFHMKFYGMSFDEAVTDLGAWKHE